MHKSGVAYTLLPFEKIGEWEHNQAGHDVTIGYVHVRVHPVVERSFRYEVQEGVAYLSQSHEQMRFELPVQVKTCRRRHLHSLVPLLAS